SEGFFRREWRYALDREMGFAPDVPFIIPVAVDGTDRFNTLPPRFRELHITALSEGCVTPEFVDRLRQIQTKGMVGAFRVPDRADEKGEANDDEVQATQG